LFVILPSLRRLTGEPIRLEGLGELQGNLGAVLLLVLLAWTLGAFGEEMAYRGYAFHRITDLLGESRAAVATGVIVTTVLFGLAHVSQGAPGALANLGAGVLFVA